MTTQEMGSQQILARYRLKKTVVAVVCLALLLVASSIAYVLCHLQLKSTTHEVLSVQSDVQRAWIEKSLEGIRTWRSGLVEQARFVSSAEMFRLFAVDVNALDSDEQKKLFLPATAESDSALSGLAEQMRYMQDLLKEFAQSRHWVSARILSTETAPLIVQEQEPALSADQALLARSALEKKNTVFGPIRAVGAELVMDMADPMYEALGRGENRPVAVLFATVPVARSLTEFLAVSPEHGNDLFPCILQRTSGGGEMVALRDGSPVLSRLASAPAEGNFAFQRRQAFCATGEVYSLGSQLSNPDWQIVLEVPAPLIDSVLAGQARQIYGLGILGSLGISLLLAFIWASLVSRSHKATASHFQRLYTVIRQQKLMLDSVNASLQTGLLLVDKQGLVKMVNPAFAQIVGQSEDALDSVALADVLPGDASTGLLQCIEQVSVSGKEGCAEVSLPHGDSTLLFRVTLYPFTEQEGGFSSNFGGCVAIFQDITEFRRRAEEARKRQANITAALVRAIESVDVHFIGHSQKMEQLVDALAESMRLSAADKETLRLAARLSQIGKIFVPHHLLTKKDKLTAEEQQEVRRAPEYAYRTLRDLQLGLPVPEAIYQMGERLDGSGQPRQLSGDAINMHARILAVVNAFCSLVSPRSYRSGMSPEKALSVLELDKGFDPSVVAQLAALPPDVLQKAVAEGAENSAASPS